MDRDIGVEYIHRPVAESSERTYASNFRSRIKLRRLATAARWFSADAPVSAMVGARRLCGLVLRGGRD